MFKNLLSLISVIFSGLFFLSSSNSTVIKKTVPEEYQGNLNIIVLMGQSNQSGYAPMPSKIVFDYKSWSIGDDYVWRQVREPSDRRTGYASDPVNYDAGAAYGATLAMSLHLHSYDQNYPLGIVTCAKGNSSIVNWQKSISDNTLYGACAKRIASAMQYGNIVAFVFHQGEYETFPNRQLEAEQWEENFGLFVSSLRSDYGEDIPMIFGQISIAPAKQAQYPNENIVKNEQVQASENVLNSYMYMTSDLPKLSDGVHLNSDSYNKMGCRQANLLVIALGIGDGNNQCFNYPPE